MSIAPKLKVSFADCISELVNKDSRKADNVYQHWLSRKDLQTEVIPFVQGFTHNKLYEFTRGDYEAAVQASAHALGNVRSGEQLPEVENFFTPFAFTHLFHDYVETNGVLPTWQDFATWVKGPRKSWYIDPIFEHLAYRQQDTERRYAIGRAIHWRLGKFYYSAMREIELLIRLREEEGINLKYHLLADTLLRVDFWVENVLLCVFFSNPNYRTTGSLGRKTKAATIFPTPDFILLDIEVERQGHGNFWRVSDSSVARIAANIRAVLPT